MPEPEYRIVSRNPRSAMTYVMARAIPDREMADVMTEALTARAAGEETHGWYYEVQEDES